MWYLDVACQGTSYVIWLTIECAAIGLVVGAIVGWAVGGPFRRS